MEPLAETIDEDLDEKSSTIIIICHGRDLLTLCLGLNLDCSRAFRGTRAQKKIQVPINTSSDRLLGDLRTKNPKFFLDVLENTLRRVMFRESCN